MSGQAAFDVMKFKYDDVDFITIMNAYLRTRQLKFSKEDKGIILDSTDKPYLLDGKVFACWDILVIHEIGARPTAKLNAFTDLIKHIGYLATTQPHAWYSLLIPFNFTTGHWALLQVNLKLDAKESKVILFDSSSMNKEDLSADLSHIANTLAPITGALLGIKTHHHILHAFKKKPDDFSCGPITAYLMSHILGLDEIDFPGDPYGDYSLEDVRIMRSRHMEITGAAFTSKQEKDLVIETHHLPLPAYTFDATTSVESMAALMRKEIAKSDDSLHLYSAVKLFCSSEHQLLFGYRDVLAAANVQNLELIKIWLKNNFNQLKSILGCFFVIDQHTTSESDLKWRDNGRDSLYKVLDEVRKQPLPLEFEQDDDNDPKEDVYSADDTTDYQFITDDYFFKGPLDINNEPFGECVEYFYDAAGVTFCLYRGEFIDGIKVYGSESIIITIDDLNISTYFTGKRDQVSGQLMEGNVQCLIGTSVIDDKLYVGFEGKIINGAAEKFGTLYVFSAGPNQISYNIYAVFTSDTFRVLETDIPEENKAELLAKVAEHYKQNYKNFVLGLGRSLEPNLAQIRRQVISDELFKIESPGCDRSRKVVAPLYEKVKRVRFEPDELATKESKLASHNVSPASRNNRV